MWDSNIQQLINRRAYITQKERNQSQRQMITFWGGTYEMIQLVQGLLCTQAPEFRSPAFRHLRVVSQAQQGGDQQVPGALTELKRSVTDPVSELIHSLIKILTWTSGLHVHTQIHTCTHMNTYTHYTYIRIKLFLNIRCFGGWRDGSRWVRVWAVLITFSFQPQHCRVTTSSVTHKDIYLYIYIYQFIKGVLWKNRLMELGPRKLGTAQMLFHATWPSLHQESTRAREPLPRLKSHHICR